MLLTRPFRKVTSTVTNIVSLHRSVHRSIGVTDGVTEPLENPFPEFTEVGNVDLKVSSGTSIISIIIILKCTFMHPDL